MESQAAMREHVLDFSDPLGVAHRETEALGEVTP
jgi:hypothetical protein